ncbi:hypothetical protein [Paraburkholderia adhaesiva]|nr:hypothetical protein [Paraburkholderia adhaesiva]
MTVCVAWETFAAMLADPNALGIGDSARELADLYKTRLAQVQLLIYV